MSHYNDFNWEVEKEYRQIIKTFNKRRIIRPKTMKDLLLIVLGGIIYPFYKLMLGIVWLWNKLFYVHIHTGDNGIMGPGFETYSTRLFSWGKLACVLIVLFSIVYIIHNFHIIFG